MKQKIINPNKGTELGAQDKPADDTVLHAADKIEEPNIYWPCYSYPFIPMMDVTIVFDELKKMVNNWFLNKRYKKKGA